MSRIVGAGLTGLWTALFLKELEPGLEVAVIEQGLAAYGASGRNAGMLSETVDHGHGLAIEHFGETEARRLARAGRGQRGGDDGVPRRARASTATTSPRDG